VACGGVPFKRCGTRLAVGAWRQGRPEHRQNIDLKESCVGNGRDVVACYNLIIRALPWQVEGPQGGRWTLGALHPNGLAGVAPGSEEYCKFATVGG
jgi:hypothetical protein